MSRACDLCGKGKMRGNTVSHSNRKAPRHFKPNLQKETIDLDNGQALTVKVCTKCKKTLKPAN
jgi:large subunit ribosomal protein L28